MHFRGGGVGHTVTHHWDEFLQSDFLGFREKWQEGNKKQSKAKSDMGDEEDIY